MGSGDPPSGDRPTMPHIFVSALADLKRSGAAILLVGDVPQRASRTVRRRLYGDAAPRRRHRIYVSTGAERPPPLPFDRTRGIDPVRWAFIDYVTELRSAARTVSSTSNSTPLRTRECTTLSELGIALSDSIAEMNADCGGFSPAQLRVGFDSLSPILANGEPTAFRFLHLVIERVKSVDGMIHCPLHYPVDSELVRLYAPLFDAIVELRVEDGEAQQRWHFTSRDIHSSWLPTSA